MVMISFNLIVFFNVKVSLFSYFFDPIMSFFLILVFDLFVNVFMALYIYIYIYIPLCITKPGLSPGFVMHKGIPIAIVRLRHKKL